MPTKASLKERKDFIFNPALSEMALDSRSEDERNAELFKTFSQKDIVDAYETQLGLKTSQPVLPKTRYKHIMLSPGINDDDSLLLDELMNDPERFQIVEKSPHWTVRGEYKIFLGYLENLDVKKAREEKEVKAQNEQASH